MQRLVNLRPGRAGALFLGMAPFLLILLVYITGSQARLAENEKDKLLPSFSQMGEAMQRIAVEPSKRTGKIDFWQDTGSSLRRLGLGVAIAALVGLTLGVFTGAIPMVGATISPLLTVISLVPPLALLPILFIVFGLGEVSKVALIAIGIAPFIARDMLQRTREIPAEQLVKAQTLGANSAQIITRVILPQLMPRLTESVRLSLGTAWLFLISAEAIASTDGLGYRIFLVRRYMSMDIILPYVVWITLLAFLFDFLLRHANRKLFPWYEQGGAA
ncbi:ABC transporter permease [Haliea sp. E17]|uniref:ABC transporter permease n=1 Tax=Haliea sp. E17 TaxID=3401576 RepID=UPI003AAB10F5